LTTADIVADMAKASEAEGILVRHDGHVPKAMENTAQTLDAIYEVPFLAHTTMEPLNCTVDVRKDGCDIWVGTQVIGRAQAIAAELTGLPPEKVVVHNHMLGGGFGRRLEVDFIGRAVQIAKQVDGPVKIVWSREEDVQHDMYRPYFYDRMAAGLDKDGKAVAWTHRICGSSIIARWASVAFKDGYDFDTVDGSATCAMKLPNTFCTEHPRPLPAGSASPQPAFSAASLSTARARGALSSSARRYATGSCLAAAASSSMKLSTTKMLCEGPTLRQKAVGIPGGS
jgi:xanthine dehydrogenase molybdopterin-binding subunit B